MMAKVNGLRESLSAGGVARVESLPLASLGDFVRGRLSPFEVRSPRGRRCTEPVEV